MHETNERVQEAYRTVKAAVFGHAVGDALGVPVEYIPREQLAANPVTDMREFGVYNQPKGAWSDDTSMTLCTLESLVESGGFAPEDMMRRFDGWLNRGEWTPFGRPFCVGPSTGKAINNYLQGRTPWGEPSTGNGSLMRIIPIILYQHFCRGGAASSPEAVEEIHRVSALTHDHTRAKIGCGIYGFILGELLKRPERASIEAGIEKAKAFYSAEDEAISYYSLFSGDLLTLDSSYIRGAGLVVDTLEAAVWCVLTTDSYEACVLRAVNQGADTDTTAAVAGGLAGALYGADAIPEKWISALARREDIDALCLAAAQKWRGAPLT